MSKKITRKKRKELLVKLQNEILKLEKEIKNTKRHNAKVRAIKNLKISARACQLICPFALSAGIVTGGFFLGGSIPFVREEHKYTKNVKQEIDSFGKFKCVEQYGNYEDNSGKITYYSKWEKTEDNFYKRNVEIYTIDEELVNKFLNLLKNNNISSQDVLDETSKYINQELLINILKKENISSIEDILGNPKLKKEQVRNDLTEKQINSDSYIEALIYDEIEDDFIIIKESVDENTGGSLFYLFLLVVFELFACAWRKESSFSFSMCRSDIRREFKRNYKSNEVENLKKDLEVKKQKYKRLNG